MFQRRDSRFSRVVPGRTSLKIVKDRKQVEQLYRPRWRRVLVSGLHGLGLAALLAAGTVWTIDQRKPVYAQPAGRLIDFPLAVINAVKPSEDPFRIAQVLRKYTRNGEHADRIARAVVSEGRRRHVDPMLVVGVMLVESNNLNPRARSFVGARGLMQVMPFHRGQWRCKSSDLYDIEDNICHGVGVLADNIKRAPNLRVALQRYNGCVRGSNTPNCGSYSGKVMRVRNRAASQLLAANPQPLN